MKNKKIVGWASKNFDIPVIWKRAIMQGVQYDFKMYAEQTKKYDYKNHIDLMHVWNNGDFGKLLECCKALNIPCKTGMDGSMIYENYKQGNYNDIKKYNIEDCNVCLEIMKKIGLGESEVII